MTSQQLGAPTSDAEITNVDAHGVWLLVEGAEYFLPYSEYPWFKEATIGAILDVQLLHGQHLYWPALDVDLSLNILGDPAAYPLVYQ